MSSLVIWQVFPVFRNFGRLLGAEQQAQILLLNLYVPFLLGTSHSCYLHPHTASYTRSSVLVSGAVRSWSLAIKVLSNHFLPSCSMHHPLCQNYCYFIDWEKPTTVFAFYNLFTYIIFKHFYLYTGHVIITDFIW